MNVFKTIKTPCVGICSTGIGDDVCRGCKRFEHEVINWNAYTTTQKSIIAARLEDYLVQSVKLKFIINNQELLLQQIQHQQIQFNAEQSPFCWIYDLLRAGASQITALSVYGIQVQSQWQHEELTQLCELIDADFYTLSCAYFDRYIAPGLTE